MLATHLEEQVGWGQRRHGTRAGLATIGELVEVCRGEECYGLTGSGVRAEPGFTRS